MALVRRQLVRTAVLVAGVGGALLTAHAVRAEVMDIGANGAVTRYAGPAVFTSEGVRPIVARPAPAARAVPATPANLSEVHTAITAAAQRQQLDREIVEAVAWRESGFRQTALSPKGAVGVMQIMPSTALSLGVDRHDLQQNVEGGAAYLRLMLNRYRGDLTLALAAYNAGPGAVDRYGGVPPFRETQTYVSAILGRLARGAAQPALAPVRLIEP